MPLTKQPQNTSVYEVTASDTLARISLRFDTTPSELSRLNHLSSTLLYPGQSLFVPNPCDDQTSPQPNDGSTDTTIPRNTPKSDPLPRRYLPTETLAVGNDTQEAAAFSPDLNLDRLLNHNIQSPTDTNIDEISRQYLKLSSQHITDDGGAISGVLLVTPQTVMFNPCFSDHMVMEHGWDAYCVRLPLRTISRVFLFEDAVAMMDGDLSKQYTPKVCFLDYSSPNFNINAIQETRKVVKRIHENCDHETEDHKRINDRLVEKALHELALNKMNSPVMDQNVNHFQDRTFGHHSEPEILSSTECAGCQNFNVFIGASTAKKRIADMIDLPLRLSDALASKRRFNDSDSCSDCSEREGTIGSRKASLEDVGQNEGNEGEITPVIRKKYDKDKLIPTSTNINTISHSDTTSAESSDDPDESKDTPSQDISVPEIVISDVDGSVKETVADVSKDSGISVSTSSGTSTSSLTEEERQWLGKRGVRLSIDKGMKLDKTDPPRSEPEEEDVEEEDVLTPRRKELDENLLMYVVLRVQKSFHYQNLRNEKKKFPINFSQPTLEHCFAVPRERADQFYNFLLYWLPDVYGEDSSGFSTPCSTECEYFEEKAKIRRSWSQYSGSSRSSIRSLSEDEIPELDEHSQIISQKQVHLLSRKLPYRTIGHRWELVYSTMVHGISLKTLYRNFQYHDCPVLIVIQDENLRVFGAFISEPPRVSDGFYGTGESMLYTFEHETKLKTFNWTGQNTFFIKGSKNSLAIGDGEGVFGLWLDEDLNHGRTHRCNTFENDLLTSTEDFKCCGLEAWGFV